MPVQKPADKRASKRTISINIVQNEAEALGCDNTIAGEVCYSSRESSQVAPFTTTN